MAFSSSFMILSMRDSSSPALPQGPSQGQGQTLQELVQALRTQWEKKQTVQRANCQLRLRQGRPGKAASPAGRQEFRTSVHQIELFGELNLANYKYLSAYDR